MNYPISVHAANCDKAVVKNGMVQGSISLGDQRVTFDVCPPCDWADMTEDERQNAMTNALYELHPCIVPVMTA
jgi:hypothetical protein